MRRLISFKAGATFHAEYSDITLAVRKNVIEFIFKAKPGNYFVINFTRDRGNPQKGLLFANWGGYFKRLSNPDRQLPVIQKSCPTLFNILVGNGKAEIAHMNLEIREIGLITGFGMTIDISNAPLVMNLGDHTVRSAVTLYNEMVKVYRELFNSPPFPAWKDGLTEVIE